MALTEEQVEQLARGVARYLGGGAPAAKACTCGPAPSTCGPAPSTCGPRPAARDSAAPAAARGVPAGGSGGVFADLDSAVRAAEAAFIELRSRPLALRETVIASIREAMMASAETLARMAHDETGLGRYEDKVVKNRLVTTKTPGAEDLLPSALSGDHGLMLVEYAPYGVIGSITPSTNPTSTIICNTIGMIAAGNAVVFNVHPGARNVSKHNIALLNEAITRAGGPANLVAAVAEPTIESAQAMMRHPGIRLLVVTGGGAVVSAAMQSGKRAICAGPGNPPVVVDETADLVKAGRDIVRGASFDNNVICTDEKEVFVVESVAAELLRIMTASGAVLLDASQARQIEGLIFKSVRGPGQPAEINRELIGRNAGYILSKIGMRAGDEVRLVVIEVPPEHPLVWTEQLMPVLPVVRVPDALRAIDLAVAAEGGRRHTATMFSRNIERLSRMARLIDCSIFVKNGPAFAGLGEGGEGFSSFSIASPTGEGMTGPRSFSRQRRCVMVDQLRIV